MKCSMKPGIGNSTYLQKQDTEKILSRVFWNFLKINIYIFLSVILIYTRQQVKNTEKVLGYILII